jgi:excisionase family DNA binding protein
VGEAPSEPRLLKARDAAAYLGLSERTLWTLANARKIPRVLFGMGRRKSVRYDRADLDAWVVARKEGGR